MDYEVEVGDRTTTKVNVIGTLRAYILVDVISCEMVAKNVVFVSVLTTD